MAHKSSDKRSARRKIASQVSSAQGGQTSGPKAASAGPKSAVYRMSKSYSDAAKKQSGGELSNLEKITRAAGKQLREVKATDFIPGGAAAKAAALGVKKAMRSSHKKK